MIHRFFTFLSLALLPWLLMGCEDAPQQFWLNAPDWSRARVVGNTAVGDPPVFAYSPQGERFFLLVANQHGRYHPQAVALDAQGQAQWRQDYMDVNMARPDQPRAYWTDAGVILLWISAEQLYQALIDPSTGIMLAKPEVLSQDLRVGAYDAVVTPSGHREIWFSGPRPAPGLYRLSLPEPSSTPELLDPQGVDPQLAVDAQGRLYGLWAQRPMGDPTITLFYLSGQEGALSPENAVRIWQPKAGISSVFHGPVLGLDATRAYVFWAVEVRTGLGAGSVDARVISFPKDQPQALEPPQQLFVPADYHLPYQPWPHAALQAGQRAPLVPPLSGKMTSFYALSTHLPETATIQRELVRYTMRNEEYQTGILFFADGKPTSYQLLSFTAGDTRSPYLAQNPNAWLEAAWLERDVEGFQVVFASVDPGVVTTYGRLSMQDYASLAGQTLFGMVMGALMFPFAMMWMIVPILLFLITYPLRRGSHRLRAPGNLISLGLALSGYWVAKLSSLANLNTFVPFSPWIPVIPDWMALPLQIGVPLIILGVSMGIAWWATYRRQHPSPMLFLLVYLAVDGVLSTAIYGPIFLGMS